MFLLRVVERLHVNEFKVSATISIDLTYHRAKPQATSFPYEVTWVATQVGRDFAADKRDEITVSALRRTTSHMHSCMSSTTLLLDRRSE